MRRDVGKENERESEGKLKEIIVCSCDYTPGFRVVDPDALTIYGRKTDIQRSFYERLRID